ncbi:MAG: glutathione peroxidase [Candidatus Izimaplasma sp.]|nr:glutathione peroxidase [Candidatus Izimaplasma bacterium]
MSVYDYEVESMSDHKILLEKYKGKVLLIVNTASKCGYTPQFDSLQGLYESYNDEGFEILGFPCNQFLHQDPENNEKILEFCQVNYGVSFPMFKKLKVKGKDIHPLFDYLVNNSPDYTGKKVKWNFEKFLIDSAGNIIKRYRSKVVPEDIEKDIKKLLT